MARREEDEEKEEAKVPRARSQTFLVVRDVVTAVVVVALVFGAVLAYTQVWPPMVVVESNSMQHSSDESFIGVIDTGDLVLVQAARAKADVTTYAEGRNTGHATYGDYGDVIIFNQLGGPGRYAKADPIIHRALLYLEWDEARGGYNIPGLDGAGNQGKWGCRSVCNASAGPYGLLGVIWFQGSPSTASPSGWTQDFNLSNIRTASAAWNGGTPYSSYVTKGDHNTNADQNQGLNAGGTPQQAIIGKARGEIPWFGLIKLTLLKTGNCCAYWGCTGRGAPCFATRNSWDALVISLVSILSLPVFLDIAAAYREKRKEAREGANVPETEKPVNDKPAEGKGPEPPEPPDR